MISPSATINESADFWFYNVGVNVITADTINKKTYENWSQFQFVPIPDEIHKENKRNRNYRKGIAIILGKIWRGDYAGKYLVAIDLDNRKAIEEFCRDGIEILKQETLIEQHADTNKMHIYFIVDREIPNKSSDKVDLPRLEKIDKNEIPAIEVKSNGKGIMYCSNSPHKNGSNYQIIGTYKPEVFKAEDVEDKIRLICKKYGLLYGSNTTNSSSVGENGSYRTYQYRTYSYLEPKS